MSGRIFVVAAEPSGDELGAELVDALRARDGALAFAGVGGPALAARGVVSPFDIRELSVLGLVEGLMAYGRVLARADETVAHAVAFAPDVAVLIDSWGFTLRVAQRLRAQLPGIRIVKYIGPQVWASRAGRARTLAAAVDHLVCIHDFEVPYYEPFGLPCTVCGHPAIGRYRPGDGGRFRAAHELGDRPLLVVLPGSRRSELKRMGGVLSEAATALGARFPDLAIAVLAAESVAEETAALAKSIPGAILIEPAAAAGGSVKEDLFAAATLALATSGTVTTEAALQGCPLIVGYRIGWITYAIARGFLFKVRHVTLLNIAAGREIVPELLQMDCTAPNFVRTAAQLLSDPVGRGRQIADQNAALERMGRGGAPSGAIAADAVLAVLAAKTGDHAGQHGAQHRGRG